MSHLAGEAKELVMNWTNLQPLDTLCPMEKIFSLLAEQCKLVELDVMDIAAEVRSTTEVTVSHAIQREVGPNDIVAIQQVMKGLTIAISMRDQLLNGEGKFDLISKCQFLLDAFTPPDGLASREWIFKMREQARFTPDENNLRKCQMDPEKMIEQLTACGDWWDKFAKTLTGQGKRGADDTPFLPQGKKPKGGGGGGSGGGASGSGYGNGGAPSGGRHGKPEGRRPDNRGAGSSEGAQGRDNHTPAPYSKIPKEGNGQESNPFLMKWNTRATFAPQHSIWVLNSTPVKERSFLLRAGASSARIRGTLAGIALAWRRCSDKKACYYKQTEEHSAGQVGLPTCTLNVFSPLSDVPDNVDLMFQKDVTLIEDEQLVMSENELTAKESSLLVLAPDLVLPVNELTAKEISFLLPAMDRVPPILINSATILSEPQNHGDNVFQVSKCTQDQKSVFNYISSMKWIKRCIYYHFAIPPLSKIECLCLQQI
jgi:hypothetical protein